jgi:hypothetical protein
MCAPESTTYEMTNEQIISALDSKSAEVAALTDAQLLSIAKELQAHFQESERKWSAAGNWVQHELQVLKLIPDPKVPEEVSDYAYTQAAVARSVVSSGIYPYIGTIIKSIEDRINREYQTDSMSKIELVSKKRDVETAEGSVEVHGPVSFPMFPGISFETWSAPSGVQPKEGKGTSDTAAKEGVCFLLGAGNQAILSIVDILQCIFVLRCPVLLKHHPLRPHLIHPYTVLFKTLIEKGYLSQVLDEGIAETEKILKNETIRHVHITGAYQTVLAVEKTLLRTRSDVKTPEDATNMVTSELGCATPFIFPPGEYTNAELRSAAKAFVTSKKTNGGCNCLSSQVIVIPKEWPQKKGFREILAEELQSTEKDPIYYPGSLKKRESALSEYQKQGMHRSSTIISPCAVNCGDAEDDDVVIVECGTPGEEGFNGYSLQAEAFGPVVAVVELPGGADGTDPVQYMEETVAPFINDKDKIFGTLSCTLLWPKSIAEQGRGKSDKGLTKAIACLQYGTVAVNVWSVYGFLSVFYGGAWGAHPRDRLRQSGSGKVGNQFGLPIEKTIIYGPSLSTPPLFDKKKSPPAIILDSLHAFSASPSTSLAAFNVWYLLMIRAFQYVLPKSISQIMCGKRPYGSALSEN